MDKKWYLFEGDAEGRRADVMLLSEEEAKIVNHVLDHMIHMVDEGCSGCLWMRDDLGGFDSKEDAFKAYCEENPWVRSDDVCEEFRDMYKEEERQIIHRIKPYNFCKDHGCSLETRQSCCGCKDYFDDKQRRKNND